MTPTLTKEDWTEIYYALEDKVLTSPAVQGDSKFEKHLKDILEKIGPDGESMQERPPSNGEYRVVWEIDLSASSPLEAAKEAFETMQEKGTEATCFTVIDSEGNRKDIDLQTIPIPGEDEPFRYLVDEVGDEDYSKSQSYKDGDNDNIVEDKPGNEESPKIVVHVEDGLIQAMYSNIPNINVKVFDLDVLDDEEEADKREEELERAMEGLAEVY